MKLCYFGKDGGKESRVWGFWLIEWKRLFSIAILRFEDGSRDAFHSHAFNAWSWVLRGELDEFSAGKGEEWLTKYRPSWLPIFTPRERFHKVVSRGRTWVLTFRGPWADTWFDLDLVTLTMAKLTHGRKVVE